MILDLFKMMSHIDLNIFKLSFTLKCLKPFRMFLHMTFCQLDIVFTFFT